MRQATRRDHEAFCRREGWDVVRNARGGTGSHHLTFELGLPSGEILRTRISHPVNRTTYGPSIWSHILGTQLQVDEAQFWACVDDKVIPHRIGAPKAPEQAIPAAVVFQLINAVGIPEHEVMLMTREQAIARLNDHWANPPT
jgi:hypothetical protein